MKWNAWLKRRLWERRMDAEFRFHLESQINDYVSQGLTREEAELRAHREFGPLELAKDESRDQKPGLWIEHLLRDARYACRSLRKSPGFAVAVIVTLALGIGANTAIFSVVHSVLLRPLPYSQPGELVSVEVIVPQLAAQFSFLPPRIQDYLEWSKAKTAFAGISASMPVGRNLMGDGEPERLDGARVSANFFSVLRVQMAIGRGFAPEEEQLGKERVVVISHELWNRRYASDPALVGKSILLDGTSHLVIGVTPPSLPIPNLTSRTREQGRMDFWIPLAPSENELRNTGGWNYGVLARVEPDDRERGRQQLQAMLLEAVRRDLPNARIDAFIRLLPLREIYAGNIRLRLLLLMGASAMLLLIACVNIANLLLARAASRSGEFATRIALGAERRRIVSQMLTESTLLAVIGGVVGAVMAHYGVGVLVAAGPGNLPLVGESHVNLAALSVALGISLLTGIVCGLFPAMQAYRKETSAALQEVTRGSVEGRGASRFRRILVGVEVALGTALLALAGLLLHSLLNVMGTDRGYAVQRVLTVDLAPSGQRYASDQQRVAFYRELIERVRSIPGVIAAGAISTSPAGQETGTSTIFYVDDTDSKSVVLQRPVAGIRYVTPGYFAASGSALRAGRFFAEAERAPVALVGEALAKRLWPGDAVSLAVGRQLRIGNVTGPPLTVVGVVGDFRTGALDREPLPQIYRVHEQAPSGSMTVIARTAQEPASLAGALRAEVRKVAPDIPVPAVRTMREILSAAVAPRRFQAALTSLFAFLALLLTAVGIYGVVSYSVACRTREVGLRIAFGAMQSDVMRWVFSHGMQPVLIGFLVGLSGAIGIARALRSLLFGITPTDPLSLGVVALVLLLTSGLACYLPARRAARLDPMVALRHE